ncbi:u35-Nephitoxin-Nsp1a_1 [Nephila pilipes]|uniref:U35-Nephitoxin-Nsp1a_1 n=1 Tax=Nephila pilipes TaxID=299642 RepID=A0A8X6N8A1_NEPPI|nr:u35-Nephitoxin-Nsp1a_1 [Nephila pilipes]
MLYRTLILLLIGVSIASAIVCPPNYCENQKCESVSCSSGEEKNDHGTFCGCCPTCEKVLKKGDSCFQLFLRGGPPPTVKCGKGLNSSSTLTVGTIRREKIYL